MARKLQDVIASLPIERQNAIHEGAQKLIEEELHRRHLRKNQILSQQQKLITDNHEADSKDELSDDSQNNIEQPSNDSKNYSPTPAGRKSGRNKRKTPLNTLPAR